MVGALSGITVIDASRVLAGPFATQILGDHGADVLKIEGPSGDETRNWGPPFCEGKSSYFEGLNRNKRSVVLDFEKKEHLFVLEGLLEGADVFVENFKHETVQKWGIDPSHLAARFPKLVHCRISGFGDDGPRGGELGYDAAVQALSGVMSVNGEREPLRVGVPIVDLTAGLNAALGIILALYERQKSGKGQALDIALYDCALSLLHPHLSNFLMSGRVPHPLGSAHPNIAPYETFETRKGVLFLAVGNDRQFQALCKQLKLFELAQNPLFLTNPLRVQNREALREVLAPFFLQEEAEELERRFLAHGIPCGEVRFLDAVVSDPHTKHRQMILRSGTYQGVGFPLKFSRTPASYRMPPPSLGEHQEQIIVNPTYFDYKRKTLNP